MNKICAWVPNIHGETMTWYCVSLPFAILLLWLIYQTIFMFLITKVMKKNRNTEPTVSPVYSRKTLKKLNCGLGDDL